MPQPVGGGRSSSGHRPSAICRQRSSRRYGASNGDQRGSAVVDFVLVASLLTIIFIAIIQLALVLHVRNTLIDAAASGARYASLADRGAADAASRTEALISMALNDSYAQNVSVEKVPYRGQATIEVSVTAPLPVIGLVGPGGVVEVTGHAATPN